MNVPTREDIARLGELVVGLEEKIDQLADRLDAIETALGDLRQAATPPKSASGAAASTKRTSRKKRAASTTR